MERVLELWVELELTAMDLRWPQDRNLGSQYSYPGLHFKPDRFGYQSECQSCWTLSSCAKLV